MSGYGMSAPESADQTSLGRQLKSAFLTPQQTSRSELRPALTLREFPPCPLCGPPYEPAPADNEQAQGNPSINPCGNDPHAQHEYRYDHRKIIRAGVAAVRAIAPPRIQNARRAHPDEGDDPDRDANRYRDKQTGKNGCFRHPPRQQAGVYTAKPVARCLGR